MSLNFKFSEPIEITLGGDDCATVTAVDVEIEPKWWVRLFQVVLYDWFGGGYVVQPLFVPEFVLFQEKELGVTVPRVPRPESLSDDDLDQLDEEIEEAYAESYNGDSAKEVN